MNGDAEPPVVFDRNSSRAVDRAAIEVYGIAGIVLMENAARALAEQALAMLAPRRERTVLVVCGAGNNGGDGYAAARHLHNAGCDVRLCALGEPREGTDAATNRAICSRMRLEETSLERLSAGDAHAAPSPELVIDAIFGTGLDRNVEGAAAQAIRWINAAGSAGSLVLSADIPSGLDCDTGRELGVAVRARCTVSFLGVKRGFLAPEASSFTGEVVIGDIGAPIELVRSLSTDSRSHRP